MITPPTPFDEEERYLDLLNYDILDTKEEDDYNELSNLVAIICECPIAAISFVSKDKQWFKAKVGLEINETPRDVSVCGHVLAHKDFMVVHDTAKDERFFDNPIVGSLKIGFYAGMPIISSAGHELGTVCVMDNKPREIFKPAHQKALKSIAALVTRLLELRLKNKLIKEQSIQLVDSQKKIAQLNVINSEIQNERIAYELHENIAQILAVAKMKAETVDVNNTNISDLLSQVKNYLGIVISEVKILSNSVLPTTHKSADYVDYIWRMVHKYTRENNINVILNIDEKAPKLNSLVGLTIYRIMQNQLNFAEIIQATELFFFLDTKKDGSLIFEHNGNNELAKKEDARLIINNIHTRAEIIQAKFENDVVIKIMRLNFNNNPNFIYEN